MKRNQWLRFCVVMTLALAGCTESFKPETSTETGNPPVIDGDLIALVVTSDEVHVRGEAGAVTPPEGQVEVTVLRTRAVMTGPVEGDGSFDVEVEASIDDVFEVRAVRGEERSPALIVLRGGAQIGEGDGGTLSCEQKEDIARSVFMSAVASADKSCVTSADCLTVWASTDCFEGCANGFASEAGLASIDEAVNALSEGLCAGYEDQCGELFALPCVGPVPALCQDGQCVADEDPTGVECTTCLSTEISWRITGAGIWPALPSSERHLLHDCNEVERYTQGGAFLCRAPVPQCDEPSAGTSIAALNAALENDVVVDALTAGGTYGEPEETAGYTYEITVGDQMIVYRSCGGGACQPPDGLEELRILLDRIRAETICEGSDCTSDFDPGPTDGAQTVWWHDPNSGTCIRQIYGLTGGNGNRYASREECELACPPPLSQADCADDRAFLSMCFECGPIAPCLEQQATCALQCADDADCEGLRSPPDFGAYLCDQTELICVPQLICL